MTAQISDVIYFNGKKLNLFCEPLEEYFEKIGNRPDFEGPHSGLWRGYIATWRIKFDQLFLTGKEGYFPSPRTMQLSEIFPGQDKEIKASWFTGKLIIPQGNLLQYEHIDLGNIYEKETTIEVIEGDLVEINTVINKGLENYLME
jgi:hypothetical protein